MNQMLHRHLLKRQQDHRCEKRRLIKSRRFFESEFVGIVRSVELGVRSFGSPADLDYKIGV